MKNTNSSKAGKSLKMKSLLLVICTLFNMISLFPLTINAESEDFSDEAVTPHDNTAHSSTAPEMPNDTQGPYTFLDGSFSNTPERDWFDETNYNNGTDGTESNPYIIENGRELAYLATLVNGGKDFSGKYIKIVGTNNSTLGCNVIDLLSTGGLFYDNNGTIDFADYDTNSGATNNYGWIPIGKDASHTFKGTVYAESGVKIYNLSQHADSSNGLAYSGFFGYLGSDAVVRGLDFVDVQINNGKKGAVVGVVAAYSLTGVTIEDCHISFKKPGEYTALPNGTEVSSYFVPYFGIRTSDSEASAVGGLIGYVNDANGTGAIAVSGCSVNGCDADNKAIISVNKLTNGMGGAIGWINTNGAVNIFSETAEAFSANIRFETMSLSGNMKAVGGIIGKISKAASLTINGAHDTSGVKSSVDMEVYGTLESVGNDGARSTGIGGLIGVYTYTNEVRNLTLTEYSVKIRASVAVKSSNNIYFGGIAGRINAKKDSVLSLTNCDVTDSLFSDVCNAGQETTLNSGGDSIKYLTIGGIVGGIQDELKGVIDNCTVTDTTLYSDGLCGGIAGLWKSDNSIGIKTISNCTVMGLRIAPSTSRPTNNDYGYIGGIAPFVDGVTVEKCCVKNTDFYYIPTYQKGRCLSVGGIVGRSKGTSYIKSCTADNVNFHISDVSQNSVPVGGILAYDSDGVATISECAANVNFKQIQTVVYKLYYLSGDETLFETRTITSPNTTIGNVIFGGICGFAKKTKIYASYSTGYFERETLNSLLSSHGTSSNCIGGIIGATDTAATSIPEIRACFSTMSLDGDIRDAVGGIVGYANAMLILKDTYFGGFLLTPNAASIIGISGHSNFSDTDRISYNKMYSPNALSTNKNITTANNATAPTIFSYTANNSVTYTIDQNSALFNAATSYGDLSLTNGHHVFNAAVGDGITGGTALAENDISKTFELTTTGTTDQTSTVTRRVKLIKAIDAAHDGLSSENSFVVSNMSDFSDYVANGGGFLGSFFKITDNISDAFTAVGGMDNDDFIYTSDTNQPFCGTFDGGGKVISGTVSANGKFGGVFGYVKYATINNFKVTYSQSVSVAGNTYFGCAVGYAENSTLSGITVICGNNTSLSSAATKAVGGILGYARSSTISNSTFTGKLTASAATSTGGILGDARQSQINFLFNAGIGDKLTGALTDKKDYNFTPVTSTVTNCYTAGDITAASTSSVAGGIIGHCDTVLKHVDNCFVYGNVTGKMYAGGIIGCSDALNTYTVSNSFISGTVNQNGTADGYAGGIVGLFKASDTNKNVVSNCYLFGQVNGVGSVAALSPSNVGVSGFKYDVQLAGNLNIRNSMASTTTYGITTAQLSTSGSYNVSTTAPTNPPEGWETVSDAARTVTYSFTSGTPLATSAISTANGFVNGSKVTYNSKDYTTETSPGNYDNNTVTVLGNAIIISRPVSANGYDFNIIETIYKTKLDAENATGQIGTSANPFIISNYEELKAFRTYVNTSGSNGGNGQYFKLSADIDNIPSTANWNTPIGTSAQPFHGTFDGNCKKISGINITSAANNVAGLFGSTVNATVKNLSVEGSINIGSSNKAEEHSSDTCIGLLIGKANDSSVSDISVNCSQKIYINAKGNDNFVSVSKAIGMLTGCSTVKGIYANGNTELHFDSTYDNKYTAYAPVIGTLNGKNYTGVISFSISDNVSYVNDTVTVAKASNAQIGGIVGFICADSGTNGSSPKFDINRNASYGSIDVTCEKLVKNVYLGGIVGRANWSYTTGNRYLQNNISGMNLTCVSKATTSSSAKIGGIAGALSVLNTLASNRYYGFLKLSASCTTNVGGIAGTYDGTLSNSNTFDKTKNPGTSDIDVAGKTSAELTAASSYLNYAEYVPDSAINFCGNREAVLKLIKGQSLVVFAVRTDGVVSALDSGNTLPNISSIYVIGNGLTVAASGSDKLSTTSNGIRVESTANDFTHTVTASPVLSSDTQDNYGSVITFKYYPSVNATGKNDLSPYLSDGGTEYSSNVYNADQLMGLDTLLDGPTDNYYVDGFGNPFPAAKILASSAYTVNLCNNISFDVWRDTVTPIGSASSPFEGTIYGHNHVIYYLNITGENAALFYGLNSATIRDVGISDSLFKTTSVTGTAGSFALTVTSDRTTTEDDVTVPIPTTFENVFSSARLEFPGGSVDGAKVGGLCGECGANTSFINSFFTGSISISATGNNAYASLEDNATVYCGGFVGYANGTVGFTDCYSATYINIPETENNTTHYAGMFVGYANSGNLTLTGCMTDDTVSANSPVNGNPNGGSYLTDAITTENGLYHDIWNGASDFAAYEAARIPVTFPTGASSMSSASLSYPGSEFSTLLTTSTPSHGITLVINDADNNALYSFDSTNEIRRQYAGIAEVYVTYGSYSRIIVMNLRCWYQDPHDGVYTLKTYGDLTEFAEIVNGTFSGSLPTAITSGFSGKTIKLGNDIYCQSGVDITVIGISGNPFSGIFDGNGYSIINPVFSGEGNLGLFGSISSGAIVQNVVFRGKATVDSTATSGTVYAGLVIGSFTDGTINNCIQSAEVEVTGSGASVVFGGIVGSIVNGKTLSQCFNMGHITAKSLKISISGIAGSIENGGTVTQCYNTGLLDGAVIEGNSYTTVIAGICAVNAGTVSECYNAGVISKAHSYHPVAIGGSITNCYIDGQYISVDYDFSDSVTTYPNGGTVVSADTLASNTFNGFTTQIWNYTSGYYPRFTAMVNSSADGSALRDASRVSALAGTLTGDENTVVSFDAFETVRFTYGENSGITVTWLRGNTGSFSTTATDITSSFIRYAVANRGSVYMEVTCGGFTRKLYFVNENQYTVRYAFDFSELIGDATVKPEYVNGYMATVNTFNSALDGDGSAASPFLISTKDDLIAFAAYANNGGRTKGRYFRLVSDIVVDDNINISNISFADDTYISYDNWAPIGGSTHPFEGTFIGDGHTISGIVSTGNEVYNGLFGYISADASISLVAVENSIFKAASSSDACYTGVIAGYSAGLITNCYTRSAVYIAGNTNGTQYAGAIAGYAAQGSSVRACYVLSYNSDAGDVNFGKYAVINRLPDSTNCGVLLGYCDGYINGCYQATAYNTLYECALLIGKLGTFSRNTNIFYNTDFAYETHSALKILIDKNDNIVTDQTSSKYGKNSEDFKTPASSITAADDMALTLSSELYAGTYEMNYINGDPNDNNGYPMLAAFDLAKYNFASFDASTIILSLQNYEDSSSRQLMNALCSYDSFNFPTFAKVTAKTGLKVGVFSLPNVIDYSITIVGYGIVGENDASNKKQIEVEGRYAGVTTNTNGSLSVEFKSLVYGCNKLCIYISLFKKSTASESVWGVHHVWSSSSEQLFPEDVITD